MKKLAAAAKVSEDVAKRWLTKQALWQIYLPAPRYIPRPKFDVFLPNAVHQADLFLPYDKLPHGRKVYKYALTVVDVASRYKAAEPLTSKESDEVSKAFQRICRRGPLNYCRLTLGVSLWGPWQRLLPNQMSRLCIICMMGPGVGGCAARHSVATS